MEIFEAKMQEQARQITNPRSALFGHFSQAAHLACWIGAEAKRLISGFSSGLAHLW